MVVVCGQVGAGVPALAAARRGDLAPQPARGRKDAVVTREVNPRARHQGHLQALNPDLAHYHQFIIERPIVLYEAAEGGDQFTDKELESLKDHIADQFREHIDHRAPFEVVEVAGPNVARIQFVVTDLNATDGLLNVSVLTKITGAGLGDIAMETEVSDSQTGRELLAAIRWGTGSRVLRAGFTRLGDAKIQVNRWARDLRSLLEQLSP